MSQGDDFVLNIDDNAGLTSKRNDRHGRHRRFRQGRGSSKPAHRPFKGPLNNKEGPQRNVPPGASGHLNQLKGYDLDGIPTGEVPKHLNHTAGRATATKSVHLPSQLPRQKTSRDGERAGPRIHGRGDNQRGMLTQERSAPLKKAEGSHADGGAEGLLPSKRGASQQAVREDDDGQEALLAAVASSMKKDKALSSMDAAWTKDTGPDERHAADPAVGKGGVLSFVDETRPLSVARKAKRKKQMPADKQTTRPFKKKRGDLPRPGELVHVGPAPASEGPLDGRTVPQGPDDHGGAGSTEREGAPAAPSFRQLGLSSDMCSYLEDIGFADPVAVQRAAVPVLLNGQDAIINYPTGSGKTLAYLAAIVDDLQMSRPRIQREEGTYALVLVPTRELAMQVLDLLSVLLRRFYWLVPGAVFGGENRAKEKARLRKGVTLVVATPGRLLDHLSNTKAFKVAHLRWLVLDEADRLLDLGFQTKIAQIIELLEKGRAQRPKPQRRRTVLLSATMHARLQELASLSLHEPALIRHREEGPDTGGGPVDHVPPFKFDLPPPWSTSIYRLVALIALLRRLNQRSQACKLLIFMSCCDVVEFCHSLLTQEGRTADGEPLLDCGLWKIHGQLTQEERTHAFVQFSRCRKGALFCTDVAARGLDFAAVSAVVQFDPPAELSEYAHRAGRTARMGQSGQVYLMLLDAERDYLIELQKAGCDLTECRPSQLVASLPFAGRPQAGKEDWWDASACLSLQDRLMEVVASRDSLSSLAGQAFRSSVRAYAAYPTHMKRIFHVKKLHLGHLAYSFCLRQTPSLLGKQAATHDTMGSHRKEKVAAKKRNAGKRGKVR